MTVPAEHRRAQLTAVDAIVDSGGALVGTYSHQGDRMFVQGKTNPLTGGIGILSGGVQVGGTASPYAFTTRTLDQTDNGQTRVCASAQVVTVNAAMPIGFGAAFKGAVSFTAGSGVTVTDVRTTGSANPWCALTQTGVDSYDIVGTKA